MNVKISALSEILDAGLKANVDAETIRTALNEVQMTLQTSHGHRTLFVGKSGVVVV